MKLIIDNYLEGVREFQKTIKLEDFEDEISYNYYIKMLNYLVLHTVRYDYFPNHEIWYEMVKMELENYSDFFEWNPRQREKIFTYLDLAYSGLD